MRRALDGGRGPPQERMGRSRWATKATEEGPVSTHAAVSFASSGHAPSYGPPQRGLFSPSSTPALLLPRRHRPLLLGILLLISCLACCFPGAVDAAEYGDGGAAPQKDWRITCYTCVNVSNNDECNRYAIDRPCPEGGDYCLTLHVMDAMDRERSLLVNKRCASLDDCSGESTGCTTAFGQTQCVSCCDQPYCNDSVPSNSTNAVFYRSAASAVMAGRRNWGPGLCVALALLIPALKVVSFGGPS